VVGPEQALEAGPFGEIGERTPVRPRHALLAFDHQARTHAGSLSAVPPPTGPPIDPPAAFLTERQRQVRAASLGALLGLFLAALARRR
jgi:hypothetical protein